MIRQSRGKQTVRAASRPQPINKRIPHVPQVDTQTSTQTMLIPRGFSRRNKNSTWATTHQLQTTQTICIFAWGYHGNIAIRLLTRSEHLPWGPWGPWNSWGSSSRRTISDCRQWRLLKHCLRLRLLFDWLPNVVGRLCYQ